MQRWSTAMHESLYGVAGFYRRERADAHFRTSVSASPLFAETLVALITRVDVALERPDPLQIVDVGAGDGALLTRLLSVLPSDVTSRVDMTAVEVRDPPHNLNSRIRWLSSVPTDVVGVILANEYLDNVPCDVVEIADGDRRYVLVDARGVESPGPDVTEADDAWLDEWWPINVEGARAEVGIQRDDAWTVILHALERGVALAIDYGHDRAERSDGAFPLGSLTGYRDGYQVVPTPDGTCDITSHVAIDACASAGTRAGATASRVLRQRAALRALGLTTQQPALGLAHENPAEYVRQLSTSSAGVELVDPASLGAFWWLLQAKGVPLPIETAPLSG